MERDYCSKYKDTKWEQKYIKSTNPKEPFTRTKINEKVKKQKKNDNVD